MGCDGFIHLFFQLEESFPKLVPFPRVLCFFVVVGGPAENEYGAVMGPSTFGAAFIGFPGVPAENPFAGRAGPDDGVPLFFLFRHGLFPGVPPVGMRLLAVAYPPPGFSRDFDRGIPFPNRMENGCPPCGFRVSG